MAASVTLHHIIPNILCGLNWPKHQVRNEKNYFDGRTNNWYVLGPISISIFTIPNVIWYFNLNFNKKGIYLKVPLTLKSTLFIWSIEHKSLTQQRQAHKK